MNLKNLVTSIAFHFRAFMLATLLTLLFTMIMVTQEYPVRDHVVAYAMNLLSLFVLSGLGYGFFGKRRFFRFLGVKFDNLVLTYSLFDAVMGGITVALAAGYGSEALDPMASFIPVFTLITCLVYGVNAYRKRTMRMTELAIPGLRWSDDLFQTSPQAEQDTSDSTI